MLARLLACDFPSLQRRSRALADLLSNADEARFTCPRGSDMTLDLSGRAGIADDGDLSGPNAFGNGTVSLTANREDGVSFSLTNAPMGNDVITLATSNPVVPWALEFKASAPKFSNISTYKNHGEYVSSQGGGSDAAHSCIGMPIQ